MSRFSFAAALAIAVITTLPAAAEDIPPDSTWRLESVAGEPVPAEVTLRMGADGSISGNASCNRYSGQNTAELPEFALGPVAATQMLCPDMHVEASYLAALELITRAEMLDGKLVMTSLAGDQMVFVPAE